jgi:hypothetical protein
MHHTLDYLEVCLLFSTPQERISYFYILTPPLSYYKSYFVHYKIVHHLNFKVARVRIANNIPTIQNRVTILASCKFFF